LLPVHDMAVINTPARFRRSSDAAAYIGLTPRRYQSGQVDYSGRISRSGNSELRACLYEAGCAVLNRTKKFSALKSWVAARKGFRKAAVAVARKIAVIMHRIWSDGTVFQWTSRKGDVAVA
jgi:transposase